MFRHYKPCFFIGANAFDSRSAFELDSLGIHSNLRDTIKCRCNASSLDYRSNWQLIAVHIPPGIAMTASIIIPAYNCEPYVAAALRSVLSQTESDIEVILVDDGSSDNTLKIASELAERDQRLRVISQDHSGTPSVARNTGLKVAKGEFISFLDADDLCAPTKIAKGLSVFRQHPTVDMVFSDTSLFWGDMPDTTAQGLLREAQFTQLAADFLLPQEGNLFLCADNFYNQMSTQFTAVSTQAVMLRRSALDRESTWFRIDWQAGEDIDLWFRLARHCKLAYIDEVLAYYRQHPTSLMQDSERTILATIQAHGTNYERGKDVLTNSQRQRLEARLARQHAFLGYHRFRQGRMGEARAAYRKAREFDEKQHNRLAYLKTYIPSKILQWLHSRIQE